MTPSRDGSRGVDDLADDRFVVISCSTWPAHFDFWGGARFVGRYDCLCAGVLVWRKSRCMCVIITVVGVLYCIVLILESRYRNRMRIFLFSFVR